MSKQAIIFPGQGSQIPQMGKRWFDEYPKAKELFLQANEILGFSITDIMFNGTAEELKQTKISQLAIFLHSYIAFTCSNITAQAVAGHSLGEITALVANQCICFEDGLKLVSARSTAMQKACDMFPSTMAAVLLLDDKKVEEICIKIQTEHQEVVVPANYNCIGQVVISGSKQGISLASKAMIKAGAIKVVPIQVSGGFHSPCMEWAKNDFEKAVMSISFQPPISSIYQNVTATSTTDTSIIRKNIIRQLIEPVRWTQIIQQMVKDDIHSFVEIGPGKVLQGLVKRIDATVEVSSIQ